jgi:hypothetical protein
VRAAALLGVALLCAACGGIPDEFQGRAPLPRCEEVELGQTDTIPAAAGRCLEKGWSTGSGAELKVTYPTTEGDPTVTYYRSVPGTPGLELFTDASRDAYGEGTWTRAVCPDATSATDLGDCDEAVLN